MSICKDYCDRILDELDDAYFGEENTLYDVIAEALDVEYIIDSDGGYIGTRIAVTLGGPACYVETRHGHGEVQTYWGNDCYAISIEPRITAAIDNIQRLYFAEIFQRGV